MTKHGGHRNGAGRKPKAQEQQLIERLDSIIDEDEVLQVLKQLIKDGDLRAVQLYLNYRRGKPKDTMDLNTSGESLGINFKDLITAIKSND
tara:strand:- start:58 stop:330 length:273 start_codon:yes stop_codon:yes gene_type:complete